MTLKQKFSKLLDLYKNISDDYLGLLAAGVAFYFLMAAFPALAAAISLYGLFSDPAFISNQINALSHFLPKEAVDIFGSQALALTKAGGGALSLSLVISIVLALYSSTKGIGALIKGLNIAYNEKETRNFLKLGVTGFVLTTGLLIYLLGALTVIAGFPAILNIIHMPKISFEIYLLLRWPILFFTATLGLQVLYSYAPCHKNFQWKWATWGSFLATAIWIITSSLFSLFVTNFGNYNQTYGSISAIVILLLWFWMSAMTILLGAEINYIFSNQDLGTQKPEIDLTAGSESQAEK